ncbi:MAG: hypothetical protein J5789_01885 [Oscillospiraceae bacterium]|nr:hypothetical protein [Oscillospiraceae bacterium]
MKKSIKMLLVLFLMLHAAVWMGCRKEEPVQWTPVRGAAQTEASSMEPAVTEKRVSQTEANAESMAEQGQIDVTEVPASSVTVTTSTSPKQEETTSLAEPSERSVPTSPDTFAPETTAGDAEITYIANLNSKKFHRPDCSSVADMKESNKLYFTGTRDELIEQGYQPCKRCDP